MAAQGQAGKAERLDGRADSQDRTAVDDAQFDAVLDSWRAALPGIDVTSISVSVSVSRLAAIFSRAIDELVRPYGFGYGEMEVLFFLLSAGKPFERRPSDLVRGCFVTSGAITGRVDRLARLGFVTRIPSLIDRRETVVRLTRDGERVSRRLQLKMATESTLATALAQIDAPRLASLDVDLRRLLHAVEGRVEPPPAPPSRRK